jgi:membrane protein implicated in regulation of membrane protease activity
VWKALANEVDSPSHIDIHHEVEIVEVEGVSITVDNLDSEMDVSIGSLGV